MKKESTLTVEEQRYRVLIDNAPEAVVVMDVELGRFIDSNENACKFFKLSREALMTKGPADVSPKIVFGRLATNYSMAFINDALQGGNPVFDWVHMDSEGNPIPCEVRIVRLPPYDKQLVRGSIIDKRERNKLEQALKDREERLQLALDSSGLGCFDWFPLESRLDWDKQMHHIFGLPVESEVDRNEYFFSSLHQEDKERVINNFNYLIFGDTQETTFEDEYRILKNGEVRHIRSNGLIFRDGQGGVNRVIGTVQDVTSRRQADHQLAYTLRKLQLSLDSAKLGIWRYDLETKHLDWNEQLLSIYGLAEKEFEDNIQAWKSRVHPDDASYVDERFAVIGEGKNVYDIEFRIIRPDGEIRYINGSGSPEFDSQGNLVALIGVNLDITNLKKKEIALRESEERFRAIFEQSSLSYFIRDMEGRFIDVNQAMIETFGYTREEFLQLGIKDIAPLNDQTEILLKKIDDSLNATGSVEFESMARKKSGELFPGFVSSTLINISNQKFVYGAGRDLTESKRIERELSEVTDRLKISTQAAKIGIWDWDIQSDRLIWDDIMFELYNLDKNTFTGTSQCWINRLHPEDRKENLQQIQLALKGESEFNTEFRIIWNDRSIHYIKAVATVQRDESGNAVRMIGTNWDITKEKEAEAQKLRARQLELKNRELEQFAYVASHDLQEPLRTVLGFVQILKRNLKDKLDGKSLEYMDFISESAIRMNQLIKALLEYSQIGINQQFTLVNCESLIKNILHDLDAQISETGAIFEIGGLPKVQGYQVELRMLFQNLISNALKFRKKDSTPLIKISAERQSDKWLFSIKDNGIGIDPCQQERIFTIFQRLHARTDFEGTGIGLAHCQKVVELHGGTIGVESTPGEGSRFYFTIPA